MLNDRRRALHARVVEAIESSYPERMNEHLEQLAHHAFRGQIWEKAVIYLRRAGSKAAARSAYREGANHLAQALEAVAMLPADRQRTEQSIDVLYQIRQMLVPVGEAV